VAKKKTIVDFIKLKNEGKQVTWVTAYDYPMASFAEQAGIDMILVGDSLGMVVLGYDGTNPVTMDDCLSHCQAVRRGAPNTWIVGDMPFMSYQVSDEDAVFNAGRFIKEAGVDCVKLEGGVRVAGRIRAIADAGILVIGHIGLTPQSSGQLGGFKAQGRTTESARAVIEDAVAVYEAGAKFVLLEGVPEEVCAFVHKILPIPVYGIGAGADCDGQVLVIGDALGMFEAFIPKFAKKYADIAGVATQGFAEYVKDVKEGNFPATEHKYKISGDAAEFEKLFDQIEKDIKF
jgi:3-methyl-2-oxobutanoate hydroxymethyltransferase